MAVRGEEAVSTEDPSVENIAETKNKALRELDRLSRQELRQAMSKPNSLPAISHTATCTHTHSQQPATQPHAHTQPAASHTAHRAHTAHTAHTAHLPPCPRATGGRVVSFRPKTENCTLFFEKRAQRIQVSKRFYQKSVCFIAKMCCRSILWRWIQWR